MPETDPIVKHIAALRKAKDAGDEGAVQIIQGRILAEQQKQRDAAGISGMNEQQLAAAGIGAGMKNVWMNVKDIAPRLATAGMGLSEEQRERVMAEGTILGKPPTPEEWAEEEDVNRALLSTTPGKVGEVVGEIAATLPVGMGAGAGLKALASGAGKTLPVAARLARPLGQTMGQGAAVGAVQAGPEQRAEGAALGAAGGALLQGAGKLAGKGIRGLVELTPAAKYLASKGIPTTVGQGAPGSALGQLEEAAQSVGGIGPGITAQRAVGPEALQRAVLAEGAPAGIKIPTKETIPEQLAAIYESFEQAYAPIKAVSVYPAIHGGGARPSLPLGGAKGALAQALADPKAMATKETQGVVGRFLQDQLSLLPVQKGAIAKVPAGLLIEMRKNIREAIRLAGQRKDFAAERLLSNAEKAVTDTLETQLPAKAAEYLRAVDAKYAQHMVGTAAVARAGDAPAGFTPFQLQQAIKQSMEAGRFARGAGGELRKLSRAGRESFDARSPTTGARLLTTGPFGWVTGPLSYAANLPGPKKLITGQTAVQLRAQEVMDALRRRLGERGVDVARLAGTTTAATGMQPETKYGAEFGQEQADEPAGSDPVKLLTESASTDPASLGPYAADVAARLEAGGPPAVARWHYLQYRKDPHYQDFIKKLGGAP
jgi:hypothetical protein